MMGVLAFNIFNAVLTLFSYPESTTITLTHVPNITFPAVTLCNINLMKRDALQPDTLELLRALYGDPRGPQYSGVNLTGRHLFPVENEDGTGFLTSTHKMDDMLLSCRYEWGTGSSCLKNCERAPIDTEP